MSRAGYDVLKVLLTASLFLFFAAKNESHPNHFGKGVLKMSLSLRQIPASLWTFLGAFQPPRERMLHAVLVSVMLVQLCSGDATSQLALGDSGLKAAATWLHIAGGLTTLLLVCLLTVVCLKRRGVRYFFPWLFRDISGIRKDLSELMRLQIPGPRPGGIAACVEGLLLLIALLVTGTGALWLALRGSGHGLRGFGHLHEGMIAIFLVIAGVHAVLALLFFYRWFMRDTHRYKESS